MRGPKPKPAALRALEMPSLKAKWLLSRQTGSFTPILTTEPPGWFNDEKKDAWRFVIENAPTGVLRNIDRGMLVLYVVAADVHRLAAIAASKAELLVDGRPNPIFRVVRVQAELMLRAAGELGFTPVARTRVAKDAPAAGDAWDDVG
jgi:phage terminase small subunit